MPKVLPILAIASLAFAGVAGADRLPPGKRHAGVVEWVNPPKPPGEAAAPLEPSHYVLYLNRSGGTYTPGREDPTSNTSSIVTQATGISPWHLTQANWEFVRTCVQDIYSPYAITVTDVEPPPNTPYIESVVAGTAEEVHAARGADFLGIAPGTCEPLDRSINFTAAKDFCRAGECSEGALQFMCEVVAQESGHAFGMDHQLSCRDPMSYLSSCVAARTFTDSDDECGEDSPRPCRCGGPTQNSKQHLLAWAGPADHVPPTLTVTHPLDGDTVGPAFATEFEVADETRIDRVELWVDGAFVLGDGEYRWELSLPASLRPGPHDVEIRVIDGGENVTAVARAVTLTAECGDGLPDCPDGKTCAEGVCLGDIGTSCDDPDACASGLCVVGSNNTSQYCSAYCTDGDDTCPGGFECVSSEFGSPLCQPGDGGGGGCRIGAPGGRAAKGFTLAALALALVLQNLLRRRRRP